MKNRVKVNELKSQLIEGIKKECQFIGGRNTVIEFNSPFKIYLNNGGSNDFLWVKKIEGKTLMLQESFDGKVYYVDISNVNDILGLAYMLDKLEEQDVKVLDIVETD